MFTCRLCQWEVTLDDVVVSLRGDRCICLRCYLRETGDNRRMPKDFRQEIDEALRAITQSL
jgi:hypothetical protein